MLASCTGFIPSSCLDEIMQPQLQKDHLGLQSRLGEKAWELNSFGDSLMILAYF